MQRERAVILIAGMLLLGLMSLAVGCSRTEEPATDRSTPGKETVMAPEIRNQSSPAAPPPIDAAAPRIFDTATFGLG